MEFKNATIQQLSQIVNDENCNFELKESAYVELQRRFEEVMQ